jgi:uncharacterized membrane protein
LDPGSNRISHPAAISTDGSTIVGRLDTDDGGGMAVRWTETGGVTELGNLKGRPTFASGVSADGTYIVGFENFDRGNVGFIWTEDTGLISLGKVARTHTTEPRAVSQDGKFIVGSSDTASRGFLWTPESGPRDFLQVLKNEYGLRSEMSKWHSLLPNAMSSDGRYVVGFGNIVGNQEAWLLDRGVNPPPVGIGFAPVPEPAAYGCVGVVVLLAAALRRRLGAAQVVGPSRQGKPKEGSRSGRI